MLIGVTDLGIVVAGCPGQVVRRRALRPALCAGFVRLILGSTTPFGLGSFLLVHSEAITRRCGG